MSDDTLAEDELFTLLGSRPRMQVLRTLWEDLDVPAYMTGTQVPMSFSTLQSEASVSDSGNFNYHLGVLTDRFVERTDGGYVLSPLGFSVMQAIDAHTAFSDRTIEPTALEASCPFCSGSLLASYDREILRVACSDCEALGGGDLFRVRCPATGSATLELPALLDVGVLRLLTQVSAARYGFCPACYGATELSLTRCPAHDPPGCDCGRRSPIGCDVECTACGAGGSGPLAEQAFADPRTIAFFDGHSLGPQSAGLFEYRLAFLSRLDDRVVSTEPLTVAFEVVIAGDRRRLLAADAEAGVSLTEHDEPPPG